VAEGEQVRAEVAEQELAAQRASAHQASAEAARLAALEQTLEQLAGVAGPAGVQAVLQGYQDREVAAGKALAEAQAEGAERLRRAHAAEERAADAESELQVCSAVLQLSTCALPLAASVPLFNRRQDPSQVARPEAFIKPSAWCRPNRAGQQHMQSAQTSSQPPPLRPPSRRGCCASSRRCAPRRKPRTGSRRARRRRARCGYTSCLSKRERSWPRRRQMRRCVLGCSYAAGWAAASCLASVEAGVVCT
jgi:hypothetical protein